MSPARPVRSGTRMDTIAAPYAIVRTSISPLVSVNRSTSCPSGSRPNVDRVAFPAAGGASRAAAGAAARSRQAATPAASMSTRVIPRTRVLVQAVGSESLIDRSRRIVLRLAAGRTSAFGTRGHVVGRLDGKRAIITGGARGIGRAIVEKFAFERASVLFLDTDV